MTAAQDYLFVGSLPLTPKLLLVSNVTRQKQPLNLNSIILVSKRYIIVFMLFLLHNMGRGGRFKCKSDRFSQITLLNYLPPAAQLLLDMLFRSLPLRHLPFGKPRIVHLPLEIIDTDSYLKSVSFSEHLHQEVPGFRKTDGFLCKACT